MAGLVLPAMMVATGIAYQGKAHSAEGVNCDDNAVIYCGAGSAGRLTYKYEHGDGHNSGKSIRAIYAAFGINGGDMGSLGADASDGTVTKSGDVYVGGKLVATGAMTAGRQFISGSSQRSNNGVTFYTRAPSVSFQEDRLHALVVMQGGTFKFAILTSCGNPVIASPQSPPHKPPHHMGISPNRPVGHRHKHMPKPPAATTNSVNVCNGDTTNTNSGVASQSGNCSTNTTNNNVTTNTSTTVVKSSERRPPPPTPPAPSPSVAQTTEEAPAPAVASSAPATVSSAPASAPSVLPNTGPGGIIGVFAAATAIGTIGYRFFLVRRLSRGVV